MDRLIDYFAVVGYDFDAESKFKTHKIYNILRVYTF